MKLIAAHSFYFTNCQLVFSNYLFFILVDIELLDSDVQVRV